MRIEVIVAAMNQSDFSIIKKNNIKCDAIIANQTDDEFIWEMRSDRNVCKMISTVTRGVGKNRNEGLKHISGDIILFADDDLKYNDDMVERVSEAFLEFDDADVIFFGLAYSKNGEMFMKKTCTTGKLPLLKSMKYGACALAIKRESLEKANLRFNENFGGGCIYSHGEDSDFIINCYKRGLKVYTYDYVLGVTSKDSSTWFTGFNEKYFYDTGALAKNTFGIFAIPYMLRFVLRTEAEEKITFKKKIDLMFAGYRNYKKLISYDEWKKGR